MKKRVFTLTDGRCLSWYEAGEGRPLVMLHGWSLSAAVFSELVDLLRLDFRLLLPDLPGHGSSDPYPSASFEKISVDLKDWLSSVTASPVILTGWSVGGMLAMNLAAQYRDMIGRLVLLGTTPRFTQGADWSHGLPATQVRALLRNLEKDFVTTLADFFNLALEGEEICHERLAAIRRFAVKRSLIPDRCSATELLKMLLRQDQRTNLCQISQPALVIHGDADRIVPVAAGRYLAKTLPRGELFELPGVGHGPFLTQPRLIASRLRDFC